MGALVFLDSMLDSLIPIALHADEFLATLTGNDWFPAIMDVFFGVGISFIVLKFLYKGFNVYIGWMDGDPDADPMGLVTNFIRAMAVAVGFPVIYRWAAGMVAELTEQVLTAMGSAMSMTFEGFFSNLGTMGLFMCVAALVFIIMFFVLYVQFLGRGVELLILRIGAPFACVGLLDSDKGVFNAYAKKFLQSFLTVVIQISMTKMGVALLLNAQVLWGIAVMLVAMRTPKLLQEFILPYGGGGAVNSVYHVSRLTQMVKRFASSAAKGGGG